MKDLPLFIYFSFARSFLTLTNTAPDDHVIQLDFRNNFNIELSLNCEYDFLEVCQSHGAAHSDGM